MKKLTLVALCVGLLAPALSSAAVLDFSTGNGGFGGTIVDLGFGEGQGFGILIDTLTVGGTGAFDGVYNVDGSAACATGTCGVLAFDTVAGTISILGSVPGLGVASTTLMSGTLDSFTFFAGSGQAALIGFGTDTKDAGLLAAVGLDPHTAFNFVGTSLGFASTPFDCEGGHCYTASSTDIQNTSGFGGESVPEPTSLLLLGSGLIGLARARRRNV